MRNKERKSKIKKRGRKTEKIKQYKSIYQTEKFNKR